MITVDKLINENNIDKHIIKDYVSYGSKIDECKQIIELTSYKEIDGKKIYWKDTPHQYLLFNLRLIANYTDIELGDNVLEAFDKLNKNGILRQLINILIQNREYDEWKTILAMCNDDLYENTRTLPSYLDTKIDSMNLAFNSITEAIGLIQNNNEE